MKKQVKTLIAILIAGGVLTGGVVSAQYYSNVGIGNTSLNIVSNDMISPRFTGISSIYCNLELVSSSGKLLCSADTKAYTGYTAYVKVELQQYDSDWSTVKTWSHNPGTTYEYVDKNYYIGNGTYRLKVTHKAYNSNGTAVDSVVSYSDEVTY